MYLGNLGQELKKRGRWTGQRRIKAWELGKGLSSTVLARGKGNELE